MPSSKSEDYDVERIVAKRMDGKGHIFYLIKWKGYSTSQNTWEPEGHVTNCQELVKEFEAEERKKEAKDSTSKENQAQRDVRLTRSGQQASKRSHNKSERLTRYSNRNLSTSQRNKRRSSYDGIVMDDENENGPTEKKLTKSISSKRSRKSATDTELKPSTNGLDSDVLDTSKLDRILNVRRNKQTNAVEYHIQVKKNVKPLWIKSNQLTENYNQQVIDFLENKYV